MASDSPSNPPEVALKTEHESERFEIDNTPPVIQKLEGSAAGMNAERTAGVAYDFQFTATDAGERHREGAIQGGDVSEIMDV